MKMERLIKLYISLGVVNGDEMVLNGHEELVEELHNNENDRNTSAVIKLPEVSTNFFTFLEGILDVLILRFN